MNKSAIFFFAKVISKNNGSRKVNFGEDLGDMLLFLPIHCGSNRRTLSGSSSTLNTNKYSKKHLLNSFGQYLRSKCTQKPENRWAPTENVAIRPCKFSWKLEVSYFQRPPQKRPEMPVFGHIDFKIHNSWRHRHFKF